MNRFLQRQGARGVSCLVTVLLRGAIFYWFVNAMMTDHLTFVRALVFSSLFTLLESATFEFSLTPDDAEQEEGR